MAKDIKKEIEEIDSGLVAHIIEKLQIKTTAGRNFIFVALSNAVLMDKKQQDYGSANIAKFGTFGVLVRINDKLERLKNLYTIKGRKRKAINESIQDSFRDLSNYAIIALLCELDLWPKE